MTVPRMKRITASSEQELEARLSAGSDCPDEVMIVIGTGRAAAGELTRDCVRRVLERSGWQVGRRYTLYGNRVGQVACRA